jgi:hypothetical protein
MKAAATAYLDCGKHEDNPWACLETFIHRSEDDVYGLICHELGFGIKIINFCPFCGKKLGKSLIDIVDFL